MTTDLAAALGTEASELPAMSEGDSARLAELVVDAKDRQRRALRDAIDGGMHHLPRLLRGPVRSVLFR